MKTISCVTQYSMGVNLRLPVSFLTQGMSYTGWTVKYFACCRNNPAKSLVFFFSTQPPFTQVPMYKLNPIKPECILFIYRFYIMIWELAAYRQTAVYVYTVCVYCIYIHSSLWSSTFQAKPISLLLKTSGEIQQRVRVNLFINFNSRKKEVDLISTQ